MSDALSETWPDHQTPAYTLSAADISTGVAEKVIGMASKAQLDALLAVACPWCGAAPGSPCTVAGRPQRRGLPIRPTTLDGNSHDARWRTALGIPAAVDTSRVQELVGERPDDLAPVPTERVLVDAGRPW